MTYSERSKRVINGVSEAWNMNRMKMRGHRIYAAVLAVFLVLGSLPGACPALADDVADNSGSEAGASVSSGSSQGAGTGGALIEDSGDSSVNNAGVSMDTLQEAMKRGDKDTLKKIADLGALTGSKDQTGSGIDGAGAYRSEDGDENPYDDFDYSDINIDAGDADEVETELNESAGNLPAADSSRIQDTLDNTAQTPNPTGSDEELTVASYIESAMTNYGYTVEEQAFHEGVVNEDGTDAPGVNILAERGANSQTNRKNDIFLIVTHYDAKRNPAPGDPFANDKSGVACLLEAGRILSTVVTDTDICFVFLSGQEDGGYGAQNFLSSLSDENKARVTGVLDVDRIGYDTQTPNILKTLTGESNPVGDLVQTYGLKTAQSEAAGTVDDEGGSLLTVGESSDGETVTAADGTVISGGGNTDDTSAAGEDLTEDESETEAELEELPAAWSYLKDDKSTQSAFASGSLTAVTLTQYQPGLDREEFEATKALGLSLDPAQSAGTQDVVALEDANLTQSSDGSAQAETAAEEEGDDQIEWYADSYPLADPDLIAQTTDVVTAAIAHVMDSAS